MAARRILQLGDPMLHEVSRPIAPRDAGPVLADLRDTLHEFQRTHGFGRGIAAVQIGEPVRAIYIEFEGAAYTIVNPVFEWLSDEKVRLWDDCFSFPGLLAFVERHADVRLRYEDASGETRRLKAGGALAELLQHEADHLDGILVVDRALPGESLCTREEYLRRYARAPGF
ncbi:MAG: peptide deformylase [bacterium]